MAALGATALTLTAAPAALAAEAGITDEVTMTLGKDGTLHVVEKISGASGELKRTFITRTRHDDTTDRVYQIANVKGGTLAGDVLTVTGQTVENDVKVAVMTSGGTLSVVALSWSSLALAVVAELCAWSKDAWASGIAPTKSCAQPR